MVGNLPLSIATAACSVLIIALAAVLLFRIQSKRTATVEHRAAIEFTIRKSSPHEGVAFLHAFEAGEDDVIRRRFPDWYRFRSEFIDADREVL